jgi:Tol biopolymer transport system component
MNADGTNDHEVGQGTAPQYARDGSSLIYFTGWGNDRPPNPATAPVYHLAGPDGTQPVPIPGKAQVLTVLAPDGNSMARVISDASSIVGGRIGAQLVQTFFEDGSERVIAEKLSDHDLFWDAPAWSVDGRFIALAVMRDVQANDNEGAYRERIDVINVETGEVTMVSARPGSDTPSISWSPDSQLIAFTAWPDGTPAPYLSANASTWFRPDDIFVVGLDGTSETNLTSSVAHDSAPAWAPDGAAILFTTSIPTQPQLVVVPMNGLAAEGPAVLGPEADGAIWSPDSHSILFNFRGRISTIDPLFEQPPQVLADYADQVSSLTWQWLAP